MKFKLFNTDGSSNGEKEIKDFPALEEGKGVDALRQARERKFIAKKGSEWVVLEIKRRYNAVVVGFHLVPDHVLTIKSSIKRSNV
jgi:hypothetical protein